MKVIIRLSCLLAILALACKQHSTETTNETNPTDTVNKELHYPVKSYILEQLKYVDSTPLAIEMVTFINNKKTDSLYIDRPRLRAIATEFMEPDLNDATLKNQYEETSFTDLSLNSITFSCTAKADNLELREQTVLLNADTKQVKNIIFRKIKTTGDSAVTMNGLWKHNMNLQLNYSIKVGSQAPYTKQVRVIWDRPLGTTQ